MKRCDDLSCLCEVPRTTEFCSTYCGSPAGRDVTDIVCACGHDACRKAVEAQLHGAGGSEG